MVEGITKYFFQINQFIVFFVSSSWMIKASTLLPVVIALLACPVGSLRLGLFRGSVHLKVMSMIRSRGGGGRGGRSKVVGGRFKRMTSIKRAVEEQPSTPAVDQNMDDVQHLLPFLWQTGEWVGYTNQFDVNTGEKKEDIFFRFIVKMMMMN